MVEKIALRVLVLQIMVLRIMIAVIGRAKDNRAMENRQWKTQDHHRPDALLPRRSDIDRAIETGISLLDHLTDNPKRILEQAFEDAAWRRLLSPHHVGLLAPPCDQEELLFAIGSHKLELLSVFPSAVVTNRLTRRFEKAVGVDIYLCRLRTTNALTIEIFRVVDGLSAEDVRVAMSDILHVAYIPRVPMDTETISQNMIKAGFQYITGGINTNKLMPEENAVTVLYFRQRQPTREIPQIELFRPGRHPLPSSPGIDEGSVSANPQ